jgi:hypothetical protein
MTRELDQLDVYSLTKEEREFIRNLLGQVNIRPAQPDAAEVVAMVKSILQKLA